MNAWFHTIFYALIADAPVCLSTTITIVGASLDESVSIPCRVSADPSNVVFEWTFSSSGERFEVPPGHYTTIQDPNTGVHNTILGSSEVHSTNDGMYL